MKIGCYSGPRWVLPFSAGTDDDDLMPVWCRKRPPQLGKTRPKHQIELTTIDRLVGDPNCDIGADFIDVDPQVTTLQQDQNSIIPIEFSQILRTERDILVHQAGKAFDLLIGRWSHRVGSTNRACH